MWKLKDSEGTDTYLPKQYSMLTLEEITTQTKDIVETGTGTKIHTAHNNLMAVTVS